MITLCRFNPHTPNFGLLPFFQNQLLAGKVEPYKLTFGFFHSSRFPLLEPSAHSEMHLVSLYPNDCYSKNGTVGNKQEISSQIVPMSTGWKLQSKWVTQNNGRQWWRSGESTRLPPVWLGFESRRWRHMWVEFVVGSLLCSERFLFGYSGFPSP